MPTTEVAFCAGTGAGTCLQAQGCSGGCRTCTAPLTTGDNCSAPVVISTRGRSRTVMTTCGARDDVNTNCGVGGNDVVFALHLSNAGMYGVRVTAPPGVTLSMGTDGLGRPCLNNGFGRRCVGSGTSRTDTGAGIAGGDVYYYVATSQPATLVIDTDLP